MSSYKLRILYRVIIILALGFLLLTALVYWFPLSIIDRGFSEEVQEHQHPLLDTFMKAISVAGHVPVSIFMVVSVATLFYLSKFKKEALFILLTLASGIISSGTKVIVNRPRPTEDLVRIINKAKNQSFPSGHTLFYVVFFGFLILLMYYLKSIPKKIRASVTAISFFMIFTIPFSRIYLGLHWFTDVLGGFLLGLICLFVLSLFYLKKAAIK